LKFHKTAKAFFGKAWTQTAWIWKSLQESLEARLYSAAFATRRRAAVQVVSPDQGEAARRLSTPRNSMAYFASALSVTT
jgi:hypothetical protein